jgi:ABC-type Fe3+-hydroxamate transport system substrate-binding protein
MILKDQMGQELEWIVPVKRIVSLVPSQTEFLHALGLENEVVGITKFCMHPERWWREKRRIGGTKDADIEKVRVLQPDLIIGNKEENSQENISDLKSICPIWMSDISNLDDAYEMMLSVGELTGKLEKSKEIVQTIKERFTQLKPIENRPKVVYFIWKKPWMVAGEKTFINYLLEKCGFENAVKQDRYPSLEECKFPSVEYVFLSSEPYPFKEKDALEMNVLFPNAKIIVVDGEYFSWYGSRLLKAPTYFQKLLTSLG